MGLDKMNHFFDILNNAFAKVDKVCASAYHGFRKLFDMDSSQKFNGSVYDPFNVPDNLLGIESGSTFGHWDIRVHCKSSQNARFRRALEQKIGIKSIDLENKSAVIYSSSGFDQEYCTTLESCSCPDFAERNLPCKHMYTLAIKLGMLSRTSDLSGIPENISLKVSALSFEDALCLKEILPQFMYDKISIVLEDNDNVRSLIASGLLIEVPDYQAFFNQEYTRDGLAAAMIKNKSNFKVTSNSSKKYMIQWIIENDTELAAKLAQNFIIVQLAPEVVPYREYMYINYCYNRNNDLHY